MELSIWFKFYYLKSWNDVLPGESQESGHGFCSFCWTQTAVMMEKAVMEIKMFDFIKCFWNSTLPGTGSYPNIVENRSWLHFSQIVLIISFMVQMGSLFYYQSHGWLVSQMTIIKELKLHNLLKSFIHYTSEFLNNEVRWGMNLVIYIFIVPSQICFCELLFGIWNKKHIHL